MQRDREKPFVALTSVKSVLGRQVVLAQDAEVDIRRDPKTLKDSIFHIPQS